MGVAGQMIRGGGVGVGFGHPLLRLGSDQVRLCKCHYHGYNSSPNTSSNEILHIAAIGFMMPAQTKQTCLYI